MHNMYDIIIAGVLALVGLIVLIWFIWKEHVLWRESLREWKDFEKGHRRPMERRLQREEDTPPK